MRKRSLIVVAVVSPVLAWLLWPRPDVLLPTLADAVATHGEPSAEVAANSDNTPRRAAADNASPEWQTPRRHVMVFAQCIDENGEPLAGVEFVARMVRAGDRFDDYVEAAVDQTTQPVVSTTDGRVRLDLRWPAARYIRPTHLTVTAQAANRTPWQTTLTRWSALHDLGVLRFEPAFTLSGHCVDTHGDPLPGIDVWLGRRPADDFDELAFVVWGYGPYWPSEYGGHWPAARTTADGRFEIAHIPRRVLDDPRMAVFATSMRTVSAQTSWQPLDSDSQHTRIAEDRWVLKQLPEEWKIRGTVLDLDGEPLADAEVEMLVGHAVYATVKTARDGTFWHRAPDDREVAVQVRAPRGWRLLQHGVRTHGPDLRLALQSNWHTVQLVDDATGEEQPWPEPFEASAYGKFGPRSGPFELPESWVHLEEHEIRRVGAGTFELRLPVGTYEIRTSAGRLRVLPGDDGLTLRTSPPEPTAPPSVRGLVVGQDGKPVPDAELWRRGSARAFLSDRTRADGRFELAHPLPAQLLVRHAEGQALIELDAARATPVELRIELDRSNSVSGTVAVSGSAPWSGQVVASVPRDGAPFWRGIRVAAPVDSTAPTFSLQIPPEHGPTSIAFFPAGTRPTSATDAPAPSLVRGPGTIAEPIEIECLRLRGSLSTAPWPGAVATATAGQRVPVLELADDGTFTGPPFDARVPPHVWVDLFDPVQRVSIRLDASAKRVGDSFVVDFDYDTTTVVVPELPAGTRWEASGRTDDGIRWSTPELRAGTRIQLPVGTLTAGGDVPDAGHHVIEDRRLTAGQTFYLLPPADRLPR